MTNKLLLAWIVLAMLTVSCSNSQKENAEKQDTIPANEQVMAEAFQALESNCFTCHSPNATIDNRIAPPMEAVKRHYITEGVSEETFTQEMIAFLNNPSIERSRMPGAVERFGLMPKMSFSEEQLRNISHYIYVTALEKPDWFEKHYQEEKQKYAGKAGPATPLETGLKFAMQTKGVLGKNLMQAIQNKGVVQAVEFCSTRALPLTDSVALALNAHIKRVSDKNRNPQNAANAEELAYILAAKKAIAKGEKPQPQLKEYQGRQIGYYPITMDKMCLQCHGSKDQDISPETQRKISGLYPQDKATGFALNELRGIWVVEMDR